MQRLLIIGSSYHYCLESSYARAFEKLGWQVHFWNQSKNFISRFISVESLRRRSNLGLLQRAARLRPDLILVIATEGLRPGSLAQLRVDSPTPCFCIYPDSPHNLDSERIHCLPLFDRVFTSSPAWVDAFSKFGARDVHYLPFAADPELHKPAEASPTHDLVFVGNWRREREEVLSELTNFNLRIWGTSYWKTRTAKGSPLRKRYGGRPLYGQDLAQVVASSKILLNLYDVQTWPGPNMRTFELPACRAFTLAKRTEPTLEIFTEGVTIECFDSIDEARDKIRFYLTHDDARLRISEAAYHLVMNGHTYTDRVNTILKASVQSHPITPPF